MNITEHAKREFEILGWPGDCEMQTMMCNNLLELIEVFSKQGHSGFSANYCINRLERLLKFKPISPLTGEDEEWLEISDGEYQNKRFGSVFKKNDQAYWADGIIFRDQDGCSYTSKESHVDITFPWMPPDQPTIVDRSENS